jgi:DNA-binding response OmpR family regulator
VLQPLDVDFAASVAESLALVAERRYAALIVDLGLPDGCGSSVIPVVQEWDPPPQVMIVSARSDADALSLSGRFGVPYCTKPADPVFIRSFATRAVGLLN